MSHERALPAPGIPQQAYYEPSTAWERAPVCFSCGRDIGNDPDAVVYLGYGSRPDGPGPGWVATLCACQPGTAQAGTPSPCVEAAQAFAAEPGAPMTEAEYRRWRTGA